MYTLEHGINIQGLESSKIKFSTDFEYILYYDLKFAKFINFSTDPIRFSTV